MTKIFTHSLKQKDLPIIIHRDNGFNCLYCKEPLTGDYVWEHLNSNRQDNRIENLALACQSCNIKKITNYDLGLVAAEKLKQNEDAGLKYLEDHGAFENNSSEININQTMRPFVKRWISERIVTDGKVELSEAINCLVYLCQENYSHGAEPTIRRYVKEMTCSVAEWQVVKDDKNKKIICKRNVLN